MKLIVVPLMFLVCFALLSMLGMGQSLTTEGITNYYGAVGYFDVDNHQVADVNGTYVGEYGRIAYITTVGGSNIDVWQNATSGYDSGAGNGYEVSILDANLENVEASGFTFEISSSLGLIALVGVLIAFATLAGLKFMGFGLGELAQSAVFKGTAYIAVWGVFSLLALTLITSIPVFGPVFYLFLTILYALGVINQIGSPGDE